VHLVFAFLVFIGVKNADNPAKESARLVAVGLALGLRAPRRTR